MEVSLICCHQLNWTCTLGSNGPSKGIMCRRTNEYCPSNGRSNPDQMGLYCVISDFPFCSEEVWGWPNTVIASHRHKSLAHKEIDFSAPKWSLVYLKHVSMMLRSQLSTVCSQSFKLWDAGLNAAVIRALLRFLGRETVVPWGDVQRTASSLCS